MTHARKKDDWKKEYIYTDQEIKEIGKKYGLDGIRLEIFFDYVKARNFIRKDYYIEEWAERFRDGQEMNRSDLEGQKILKKLAKKYYRIK